MKVTRYSHAIQKIHDRARIDKTSMTVASTVLISQQAKVLGTLSNLENVATNPNPLETEAAHKKRVYTNATKLIQDVERMEQERDRAFAEGYSKLTDELFDKTGMREGKYSMHLLQHYQSLSEADRMKFLKDAVDNNKGEVLYAVFDAPECLTNVTKEMSNRFTESLFSKHQPALFNEQKKLMDDYDDTGTVLRTATRAANEMIVAADVTEINRQAESATQAQKAFDES